MGSPSLSQRNCPSLRHWRPIVLRVPAGVPMIRGMVLDDLVHRAPGMPQSTAEHCQHSCMICMDSHSHVSGVLLEVDFRDEQEQMSVSWQGAVSEDMRRWFRDQEKSVERAACAVALLIVSEFTSLIAIAQSAKGDGVDYSG